MLDQEQDVVAEQQTESSPVESNEQQPTAEAASDKPESAEAPKEKEAPFHEHPRFKELVEQKNQAIESARKQELALAKMQAQFEMMQKASQPKVESETDKLYKDLEAVDPRLAKHLRDLETRAAKADEAMKGTSEFREWKQQQDAERSYQQAMGELNRLHGEYKVPKELSGFYEAQVKAIAGANPQMQVKDLANVYKTVHEQLNGYLESQKRQTIAQYSTTKKLDAKTPVVQQKGSAPGIKKPEYSTNPEEAKAQITKNIVKSLRAAKDI